MATDRAGRVVSGRDFDHPDEIVCPGGPLLLRGDRVVRGPRRHRRTAPPGRSAPSAAAPSSSDLPWCDGTHKVLPAADRPA